MSRTANIQLTIELDNDDLPTQILWQASDSQQTGPSHAQSVMLSMWNSQTKTTAAIDLWSKDMTIDEMDLYFYQVIHKMANTYLRATKNTDVAKLIHQFGEKFGKTLGLLAENEIADNQPICQQPPTLARDPGQ